jgi:hypothetical protein
MIEWLTRLVGRLLLITLLVMARIIVCDHIEPKTLAEYRDAVLIVFPILTVVFIFMNWDQIV